AHTQGISLDAICVGLSQATAPPGRLERVSARQPFDVLVHYAHTPHAFQSVLATLRRHPPPPRRLIGVFGATGNRDRAKRPVLAQIANEYADFFFITNEDPYGEQPEAIIDEVAAGVPAEQEGKRYQRVLDRQEAIHLAIASAGPGDMVVI